MKYAIPITESGITRLTQPVEIPNPLPSWANDPLEFLAKMFPDFSGFIEVSDKDTSGAVRADDGSWVNSVVPDDANIEKSSTTKIELTADQIAALKIVQQIQF